MFTLADRLRVPAIAAVTLMGLSSSSLAVASAKSAPTQSSQHESRQQTGGPTAAIGDSGDAVGGKPVVLNAAASPGDGLTYAWDFGDGSAAGSGATVAHTFPGIDDYRVRLTVQDRNGRSDSATRTLRAVPGLDSLVGQPVLGQIVPAGSFTAVLALSGSGIPDLSVRIGGQFLSSDKWDYAGNAGASVFEVPDVRVANEDNPDITDLLLKKPDASIPLNDNVSVTVNYTVPSGANESVTYTTSLQRPVESAPALLNASAQLASTTRATYLQASPTPAPRVSATPAPTSTPVAPAPAQAAGPTPPTTWSITYPNYLPIAGTPADADDIDGYYLKGDKDFHAVDDLLVRRYAIKVARSGGVFPDDPQRAADNIYRWVNGLLGIGDPGELQTDVTLLSRVQDKELVPGARKGEYICIAHAYLLSSLTRTLGLPTRELTIGFGRGVSQDNSGGWLLNFYQEGANEVWYAGAWHHYDTWVGTRDRADYLATNLTEIAWYAYSVQRTPFTDVNNQPVGVAGHDFALGKYVGSPGSPGQWRFLEQQTRRGVRIADPGPDAYLSADHAPAAAPAETVVAGIRNPAPQPADLSSR